MEGDGKGARTRRLRLHSFILSAGPPACPTDGTKPPPCLNPPEHLWANRGPLDFPSIYVQFDDVSGFLGLLLRCFAHVGEVSGSPWPTFKFMYRSTRSRCPLDTPANHVGVGETSGSPVDLPANLCANRCGFGGRWTLLQLMHSSMRSRGPLGFSWGFCMESMKFRGPRGPLSTICTGRRSLGTPWAPLRIYVQVDEVSGPLGPHPFF